MPRGACRPQSSEQRGSGDPAPSADDADLTDRLRAASELVGVLAWDHGIVAATGYYSFVEAVAALRARRAA